MRRRWTVLKALSAASWLLACHAEDAIVPVGGGTGSGGSAVAMPLPGPRLPPPLATAALEVACGTCHGNGACEGGLCTVRDVDALLADGWIVAGDAAASPLYLSILSGRMPPAGAGSLMPGDLQNLSRFIATLRAPQPSCDRPHLSWDDVYEALQEDLLNQPVESRPFLRYVSLTNRYDAGACEESLELERSALDKVLNSLSQAPEIARAVAIADPLDSRTLYRIDLRHYALDASHGPFEVDGSPYADAWEAIIGNNRYAVELEGAQADDVIVQTTTTVPVVFLDALIAEVMRGGLYAGLLRLPDSRAALRMALGLEPELRADEGVVLAGTIRSLLTPYARIAARGQRPNVTGAFYYENFEVDPRSVTGTLFGNPLGFMREGTLSSEVLFTLPNGLQAFMLFDGVGARLEEWSLLFDAPGNDTVASTAISCLACHAEGPQAFEDEVRSYVLANEGLVSDASQAAGFDPEDVLGLYSGEFSAAVAADAAVYQRTLAGAGVLSVGPDPVYVVYQRFEQDLLLAGFAGDMLYPVDDLRQNMGRVDPALSGLDDGFSIDRADGQGLYLESLCILLTDGQNRPSRSVCEPFGL